MTRPAWLTLVLALGLGRAAHADTSATLATAINLPQGPASIEGFGHAYEVHAATGLPSLVYAIEVPPGRAGLTPQLGLHYHAGTGVGVVGLGWSLDVPAIERSTRGGMPRVGTAAEWQLRHLGDGEVLVEVRPGEFRQRIEASAPVIVRSLAGGAMAAITSDGTGYLFGLDTAARVTGEAGIVRLELSAITDVHGNRIDFRYTHEPGTDVPLLAEIAYNDGAARIVFAYTPRPDVFTSRATGQARTLAHRLATIRSEVAGQPVRTTTLTYAHSVAAPSSRLVQIATIAADGTALPTWRMSYVDALPEPVVTTIADAPAIDPTADGRAWLDIDGDALPDLLVAEPGQWRYRKNLGNHRLAATWTDLAAPAVVIAATARFADVTGDGVQDLLAQPTPGELRAFVGGGAHPFASAEPVHHGLGIDLTSPQVALVDLNLDGRVDLLHHDAHDAWAWLRLRDGSGYEPADAAVPPPAGMRLGEPGVSLADMDGDRLADLVRISPSESRVIVAPARGFGEFDEPFAIAGIPEMHTSEHWQLADLNGDGAADLLRFGGSRLDVYLNQQDGSMAALASIAWPALAAHEVVLVSDIDGDGCLEVVRVDPTGAEPWRAWSLFAGRPGLLLEFANGLGYTREHSYRPAAALAAEDAAAGHPWHTTPPEPLPVLTTTREYDGLGQTTVTDRRVRDGWYDPARGEFRGFEELRHDTAGDATSEAASIVHTYDLGQADEARGLQLVATTTSSPRGVLVREDYTLTVETPAPGIRSVRRTASDTYHLEAGPETAVVRVRSEWDYDEWGNIVEARELGRVDRLTGHDIPGDERITTNLYATPAHPDGPRDRIAEVVISDGDGTQLAASRTYYDGPAEQGLPLGHVEARGVLIRIDTWIADDDWVTTLRQRVDAYGNVLRVRDGEGGTLERRFDAGGLFPVEERLHRDTGDPLVTTAEWDLASGQPTAVTRPNGATTRVVYDGLGRMIAEILPGDTADLPTTRHHYHLDGTTARPSIITELRRRSGEPEVDRIAVHLDGLGRTRVRVTQSDDGTAAILEHAQTYSAAGTLAEQFAGQPLAASALQPGATIALAQNWPRSSQHVDALGRPMWTRDADGYETATTYSPLSTQHRDHEDLHPQAPYHDTPEQVVLDGLGRTIARQQLLTDRTVTHAYAYDAADRLVAITDPAGHTTKFHYNGADQLIKIDSPDAGTIQQRFDRTGRLVERRDATGARATWTFDPLGRLLHERSFDPHGTQIGEIRHSYDGNDDDDDPLQRGQLTAVTDDAGTMQFTYDARGRATQTTREFASANGPITLTTGQVYDAQDRVIRDIFPDGSSLDRDYNPRGLERPLEHFVATADYDALARWRSLTLPADISLTRDLDHHGRVLGQHVHAGTKPLLALTHQYDHAGQLAHTRDDLAAEKFSLTQSFGYDDLRRLVHHTAGERTQTWQYSDDGNLLAHAGRSLQYQPSRPHAATALGNQQLSYDAAGQLAHVQGTGTLVPGTWTFDPHGRVRSFTTSDGNRVEHIYGYTGELAIRREYTANTLQHETLYLHKNAEVRDGKLVRWIYFAGERIAESPVAIPEGGFADANQAATLPTRGRWPGLGLAWLVLLLLALALAHVHAHAQRKLADKPPNVRRPPWSLWHCASTATVLLAALLSCNPTTSDTGQTLRPDEHTRFHIADRLGSSALILDADGQVLARDAAEPYGAARLAWRRSDDVAGPTYRFTGKEDDTLSGAVIHGARHYLPALGRWASPDRHFLTHPDAALTTPAEQNPYTYVAGNPVAFTDPTGKKGLAHGSENRPGILDNYPDSPNAGFESRMDAVAYERALADVRHAELKQAATAVLDLALTAVDWALTASDIADGATMAAGAPGIAAKLTKQGAKTAIRQSIKAVRKLAKETASQVKAAKDQLTTVRRKGSAGGERAGLDFLPSGKVTIENENRARHGGKLVCENCGVETVKAEKSRKGVTPPRNEKSNDHIIARANNGDGVPGNGQILCRTCNRAKSDK